jgi:predicted nucleic acid-binding protein
VSGFERLIPAVRLPDPDDLHVLAAAVNARADLVVTVNLKDFATAVLAPHGIVAMHPGAFVEYPF